MSDDTLLSNMQEEYNELAKRCQRANKQDKPLILQQMAHITKLMRQALHNTAEVEIRKYEAYYELNEIKKYLIANKLVSYDILDDIQARARVTAREKVAESEKAIDKLYGEFINVCSNTTKSDPTARDAIKRT
jgi:hypothetical protein